MKKLLTLVLSIILLTTTFFWSSCLKTEDEGGWAKDDKESYDQVINLQDEIGDNLDDWFQSMDSLDAIEEAYQAFENSDNVSSATINSKGIAVQYMNGMRGGIFLKGKLFDYKKKSMVMPLVGITTDKINNFKSIVNGRKMIQMDAAYTQFRYYTDLVNDYNSDNLSRVDISITEFLKDNEVTLDRLTQLSDYGIIDMSGHGIPWPKENYITEIYYLTGETVSDDMSKKYWDEIKTGSIPIVKVMSFEEGTKYCISPDFITKHNDFSQDTVFFYGGFCFSFLGDWPDIINGFADGAYLGFDWSVQGYNCANWDINSLALMSDTSKLQPMNLEEWMQDESVSKSYNDNGRIVSIHYTGDGNLTLWSDTKVRLIPLSSDGVPVSVAGEAGTPYPFKCEVVSNVSELEYSWDIGDGSSPVVASNAVNITWSEEGTYLLTVTVRNKNTTEVIGSASLTVTIGQSGNNDLIEFLPTCSTMSCQFGPSGAFTFSPEYSAGPLYVSMSSDNVVWSGLSFSGTKSYDDGGAESISGSISGDGQTVSYVAHLEYISEFTNDIWQNYTITVSNLPLTLFDPDGGAVENPSARYGWTYSENFQQYVTSIEGYEVDGSGTTHTVTGVNWSSTDRLNFSFWKVNKSKVVPIK